MAWRDAVVPSGSSSGSLLCDSSDEACEDRAHGGVERPGNMMRCRAGRLAAAGLAGAAAACWLCADRLRPSTLRGALGDATNLGSVTTLPPVVVPFEVGDTIGMRQPWKPFQSFDEAFSAMDRDQDGTISVQRLKQLGIPRSSPMGLSEEEFKSRLQLEAEELVDAEGPVATGMAARYAELTEMVKEETPGPPRPLNLRTDGRPGLVEGLYTFGAPGTSRDGLYDPSQSDGCIRGYRVFSRSARYTVGTGTYFRIVDPVAYICGALQFSHARMETMEAGDDNLKDTTIHTCSADRYLPNRDDFWAVSLHSVYSKTLRKHVDRAHSGTRPALDRVLTMSWFAFGTYEDAQKISVAAPDDLGWNHVGRACAWIYQAGGGCKDKVDLYQHPDTLDCVLAFEGTDDVLDWLDNMNIAPTDFCGFEGVHSGFKSHLFKMIRGVDYAQNIHAKLPKCASLSVTGHSLGGAQAELFTACANRALQEQDKGYGDYRLVHFVPGEPEKLPQYLSEQAPGVFLRNKGNGLCMDVRGTMQTEYQREIIMFDCETAASDFSKDQRWDLVGPGYLVNRLSGLCMEPAADGKSTLQMPCRIEEHDTLQQWSFTNHDFLMNAKTGKCLDSTMELFPCPVTDQKWKMTEDGHLVNQLSGKCLDVKGNPGTKEGTDLVLWDCENTPNTDQLWEFGPRGHIKNKLSGLCINVRNHQGRENKPDLVIGKCQQSDPFNEMLWEFTPDGFIMNKNKGMCIDVRGRPGTQNDDLIAMARCEDKFIDTSGLWKMMPGGFIRNFGNDNAGAWNQCIEVMGDETDQASKKQVGAKLHMDRCELITDQKWELPPDGGSAGLAANLEDPFNSGFIRNVIGGRKCIDIRHTPSEPGDRLWLQNCEEGRDPARFWDIKWSITPEGKLKNELTLKCLDVQGANGTASGSRLFLNNCDATRQTWKLNEDGFLVSQLSSKCMDVKGESAIENDTPLVLWECEYTKRDTDQKWELTRDGFLRNRLSWKCALPTSKNELVLQNCPQSMQRWDITPDGFIKNRVTGQCIDAVHNNTASEPGWWNLLVWKCDPSRLHQQWEQYRAE